MKYSGCDLLADLNRDARGPLSGELRCDGSVKNFLRMTSCDFEYMYSTISHKVYKLGHELQKVNTSARKTSSDITFFGKWLDSTRGYVICLKYQHRNIEVSRVAGWTGGLLLACR